MSSIFGMKFQNFVLFFISLQILLVQCGKNNNEDRKKTRYPSCREHIASDNQQIEKYFEAMEPDQEKPKGYMGTVGILGGTERGTGPAYFAAMTALRLGADSVEIYCTQASAALFKRTSSDIMIYPLADVDHNKMNQLICNNDVVLIGPGLELTQHSINLMTHLIPFAKNLKKPLIFDLDEFFLTQDFLNKITQYPLPGVTLLMNNEEFEKFYPLITITTNSRKGCTDMAFTSQPITSWSLSKIPAVRHTDGQGSMIAGATAVYLDWAIKKMTQKPKNMLPASIATHAAAKLMRTCNNAAYTNMKRNALTSDMLKYVGAKLF